MFENACTKTVSILHALLSGADGACIDLGTTSLLGLVVTFVVAVVVLKFAGRYALSRLFGARASGAAVELPTKDTRRDEGPICSIRD